MKKLVITILSLILTTASFPQLATNLILSPTPLGTLSDWANRKEVFTFLVINQSGAVINAVIKAEIKLADGTIIATTNLAQANVYSFSAPSTFLDAADVLALQHMVFSGKYNKILNRTGKLPEGGYQVCVQLVTPVDFRPLSPQVCKNFYIAGIQLPNLMMPVNESALDAIKSQSAIIFRWTSVSPAQQQPVIYRIQVFEILNYQTPMQAFRSNQPLLDKEVIGTTQYTWQPQMDLTIPCCDGEELKKDSLVKAEKVNFTRRFIWAIQSMDNQRRPLNDGNVNGDGRSEPAMFYVGALKKG